MINANELRIGNLIYNEDNEVIKVVPQFFTFTKLNCDICNAIPLTEEWLVNFGFKYNKPTYEWYNNLGIIYLEDYNRISSFVVKVKSEKIKEIRYVHELQNLHFFLTGSDLTIA